LVEARIIARTGDFGRSSALVQDAFVRTSSFSFGIYSNLIILRRF